MSKRIIFQIIIAVLLVGASVYIYFAANKSKTFYARFDVVNGLQKAAPVMVQGVKNGQVTHVELDATGIMVEFEIDKTVALPEGTIPYVGAGDVSGSKAILLKLGSGKKYLPEGSTLTGLIDSSLSETITANFSPFLFNLKSSLKAVDGILITLNINIKSNLEGQTREGIQDFSETMEKANTVSAKLIRLLNPLHESIVEMQNFAANPASKNNTVNKFIRNADPTVKAWSELPVEKELNQFRNSLSQLSPVFKKLSDPNSKTGKMLNESSAYHSASRQLDTLDQNLKELQQNLPGITIFGKKKKK